MWSFYSARERYLWICVILVLLAIALTLAFGSALAGIVYHQGVSAILFLGCMILVGLTIVTRGMRTQQRGVDIGVCLGITVVYIMVFFRLTIPERSHLIEYSVLAVLIYEALAERAKAGGRPSLPALMAFAATSFVGALDEFVQLLIPSRHFEWTDILFNILAALFAIVAIKVMDWARHIAARWLQLRS